jgi:hypothetical protein
MRLSTFCALSFLSVTGSTAFGYLGSFAAADGYYPQYGTVLGDVTYYNAGQSGANAGGGPAMAIPADSGLWTLQSGVGGVFPNAAARSAFTALYPSYPPTPGGTVAAYLLGGHFPGRNADGANMAFRNDTPIGTGAAIYRYEIDTYDTGGPVPASVTSGDAVAGFYFCPNPADPSNSDGSPGRDKFILSLRDSAGNVGLQWGYTADNQVYWRDSASNPWTYTGTFANASNWDGVTITMDLTADTFDLDYYVVSTNTWFNMATNVPMGQNMGNFTEMDWHLEDGFSSGLGGKNYFDDFSIVIPEPASLSLVAVAFLTATRRRR